MRVTARFREQGSVLAGTKQGRAESFLVELHIESEEPRETILELIRLAHRMCFTESALAGEADFKTRSILNGQPVDED